MSADIRKSEKVPVQYMTVEQFIVCMWRSYIADTNAAYDFDAEQILQYGWDKGWLEEQDVLWRDRFIERRNAARIVHEFLRLQCEEKDERDFRRAEILTDLYDCRACAKHVAQVYLKGIMPSKEEKRFQLLQKIEKNEANNIIIRMFDAKRRLGKEGYNENLCRC